MSKKIIIILLSVFIASSLTGEEIKDNITTVSDPDSLIPGSAVVSIKIQQIVKAVDFINAKKEFINFNRAFPEVEKWIRSVKEKTEIDLLNAKSLKETGVDINKAFYMALLDNGEKNETIIIIPVKDKKNFPFTVVKLLKKTDETGSLDLNPAISSYKGFRVFQIQNNIFFTVIDDYFILTHSGSILSEIIDLKSKDNEMSLSADAFYKDYKIKSESNNGSNIISIFIKKAFLNRKKKASDIKDTDNGTTQIPKFNFVNYISLQLASEGDEMSLTGGLSVNKEDPFGNFLMQAINTGLFEKALFADNPTGYHFVSLDINKIKNYLDQLTDTENKLYRPYSKFQRSGTGENVLKDAILPCSKSFINLIFTKSKNSGQMDNAILYIPMKDCGEIDATLKKIKAELKKRYTADEAFGEEKINGINSFWFKDDSGNKYYILENKGNFYAGNDIESIKVVLNTQEKNSLEIKKDFIKKTGKNTFLLSYTQFDEESFFKAVLLMLAFNQNPGLYGFISKIESIILIGEKIDSEIILNLKIKILSGK